MAEQMQKGRLRWWVEYRWTLSILAALLLANAGLFGAGGDRPGQLIEWLQFNRQAICEGQIWRLLSGNMVHWSREHFMLDVAVFVLVGLIYEPRMGRFYPWVILVSALAVGLGVFIVSPEMATYRGLSGVDSGQFAAALAVEYGLAHRCWRRWLWLAPVTAVFVLKIAFESISGQMFFATESLGDIGLPVPIAHAAGAVAGAIGAAIAGAGKQLSRFFHAGREFLAPIRRFVRLAGRGGRRRMGC